MFKWDLGKGRCSERVVINGAIEATSMVSVGGSKFLIGTEFGHISLHSLEHLSEPIKTFNSIKSKISGLYSRGDLAFAISHEGDNKSSKFVSVALFSNSCLQIHVGEESSFIYQGWPENSAGIPRSVCASSLSPYNGMLVFGGTSGMVSLYKPRFA